MLKKWSCVAMLAAFTVLPSLHARNIFVTAGGDTSVSTLSVFSTDSLQSAASFAGPAGVIQVLAGPGGKYYAIGRTAAEGVAVIEGTFPALQVTKRIALSGVPNAAAITPDGRRLIVVGTSVQVIDTATDALLPSTDLTAGSVLPGVAVSTDSRRAYVISQDLMRLTAINLEGTNPALGPNVTIQGQPSSVSVSPAGQVYATVQNAIYEFNPQTLALAATYSLNGFPGPVTFTPDAHFGLSPSTGNASGKSGYLLDLLRKTVVDIPSGGFNVTKIVPADNNTAYAYSSQNSRVYLINLASLAAPVPLGVTGVQLDNVRDIAISNEAPQAKSLFLMTLSGLYRVDRTQNTAIGPFPSTVIGPLSYAGPAATGTPTALLQIGNTQTVAPGASSSPLIVRAVNAEGIPLAGVTITFTTTSTVSISATSVVTDMLGFAQVTGTVAAGTPNGVAQVTATSGGQSVDFTINISSAGPGPGPGPGPQGALSILRGQGQIVSQGFALGEPLSVIVRDTAGNPVPNVPVTFTVTDNGAGSLGTPNATTNELGIAETQYQNPLVPPGTPYTQAVISASTGGETVNFIVTTVPRTQSGSPGQAIYERRAPADNNITVGVGETATGAIQVVIGSLAGQPIPNVGLRIATDNPAGPTATCRGGVPLSDATGVVTCDVIGGGQVGQTTARIIVGESVQYPFTLNITAGSASTVRIASGNNQTGNAGALLPQTLSIEVLDGAGNLLSGVPVTWEVVTPGTATLSETTTSTDINGKAFTKVTLGQQQGVIQIRARAGTGTATFGLTVNPNASSLAIVSGNNQSAAANQAFAQPLTIRLLNEQGQPVPGAGVAFQVTSGTAQLSAPTATTNMAGEASVNVTAGATPGPVVVQASLGAALVQNFALTVRGPGPVFTAQSILNAAGYQPGISPGSLAVISAQGIAPGIAGSVTPADVVGPLPVTLAGVQVLFNNIAAPIYAVSNIANSETVIVQVPFEINPGAASVTITTATGGSTTVEGVRIDAVKPGIFDWIDPSGRRYAVALRPDGSYVSSANPARRGESIRLFVDGLGQTTPATGTNRAGARDQFVAANVIAGINNEGVRSGYAKLLEGSIGVYIVDVEIPANTTTGDSQPVAVAVAGPDGELVFAGSVIPIN